MKIVKLEHGFEIPPLWLFMQKHLPSSLIAYKEDDGYGHTFAVRVKTNTVANRLPVANWLTDRIATVWSDSCELFHPQYYSDFEDVIRKYESQYGREVEFRYWQAS